MFGIAMRVLIRVIKEKFKLNKAGKKERSQNHALGVGRERIRPENTIIKFYDIPAAAPSYAASCQGGMTTAGLLPTLLCALSTHS